jgi:hypothetical protein
LTWKLITFMCHERQRTFMNGSERFIAVIFLF